MRSLYLANVTVHVLAAVFWLGGMFFLGLVGAPVLRAIDPPSLRQKLFNDLGERFRSAGWIAIGILLVTGIVNMYFRGWLHWDGVLDSSGFWASTPGRTLACKLLAVAIMIGMSAVHDFALGPAASREEPGSAAGLLARRRAARLARLNAIGGLVVLVTAVLLARSG